MNLERFQTKLKEQEMGHIHLPCPRPLHSAQHTPHTKCLGEVTKKLKTHHTQDNGNARASKGCYGLGSLCFYFFFILTVVQLQFSPFCVFN